jgi:hypothetical protein
LTEPFDKRAGGIADCLRRPMRVQDREALRIGRNESVIFEIDGGILGKS